jgi:hypothetical protein
MFDKKDERFKDFWSEGYGFGFVPEETLFEIQTERAELVEMLD